jgi:hypothetical protein
MKNLPTARRATQRVNQLKKQLSIPHKDALKILANEYGFDDWKTFKNEMEKNEIALRSIPVPTTDFIEDQNIEFSEEDFEDLDNERAQDIEFPVKKLVAENKIKLTKLGVEYSIFEPTITGLKKSIVDATQAVRAHFELEQFHFYDQQKQGPIHKVNKPAYLVTDSEVHPSNVSLYRPLTKNGDPRMWFKGLPNFSSPQDQIAIVISSDEPYLINLSHSNLDKSFQDENSKIGVLLRSIASQKNNIAEELLEKIKILAKQPFAAQRQGDTAIGYTLETLLGIAANSSKQPDYKGIEIKSGRGQKNRTTLFAQVPDWNISPCKRSAEILNKYGYTREEDFKLYCTLSTQKENSQGLSFIYDSKLDQLQEWHNKSDLVAIWPGKLLRKRLKEKHAETFWVEAKSQLIRGVEHFQLTKVTHTKSPIISQLMPLIEAGVITMDHLIKHNGKTGKVSEKGPLFKINKRDLSLLFPEPVTYSLRGSE